jgi:hypothetical protein
MTPDEVVGKISMSMEGEGLAHFLGILRMGFYAQADVTDSALSFGQRSFGRQSERKHLSYFQVSPDNTLTTLEASRSRGAAS